MLRFDGVSFHRGPEKVISDVSFEIRAGEFAALLGENGAGKSTLCRLSNGLLKPSSGRVTVCGDDTARTRTSVIARNAGFLFQNPDRQLCQNTVLGEIVFGLEHVVSDRAERERRAGEMLAAFSLDGGRDPFGMSRGERQQVALASILARKPRMLILDEPTTGLDYRECMTIMGVVSRLNAEGTTILMVSHDMEVTADFAERALVLSGGRLIADGPVRRIMRDVKTLDEASLLPAQIPALAVSLGGVFSDAFTVDDMTALVERANATRGEAAR
ncbi:MAG: energy-coupling factor ABC transporter ATP-binding protein [Synergistaceae bacterium]|nr:energy-coupling factor ABC transporter ATP-binding protein [Synergistaceae bacterium]